MQAFSFESFLTVIGNVGAIIFVFIVSFGIWQQYKRVVHANSVEALSTAWVFYNAPYFVLVVLYGLQCQHLPLICNVLPAALSILLLVAVWRRIQLGVWEVGILVCGSLACASRLWLADIKPIFAALSLLGILFLFTQPYVIWRDKRVGVYEPRMSQKFLLSSVFTCMYALGTSDWYLFSVAFAYGCIHLLTLSLWQRYKHGV